MEVSIWLSSCYSQKGLKIDTLGRGQRVRANTYSGLISVILTSFQTPPNSVSLSIFPIPFELGWVCSLPLSFHSFSPIPAIKCHRQARRCCQLPLKSCDPVHTIPHNPCGIVLTCLSCCIFFRLLLLQIFDLAIPGHTNLAVSVEYSVFFGHHSSLLPSWATKSFSLDCP